MTQSIRSAKQLGALIREERLRRRLSQQDLANLAGTGQKTISAIENGNEGATLETVFRLLAALELEIRPPSGTRGVGQAVRDVF